MSGQESLITQEKLPRQGYFAPGGVAGPGRPKGSRNKIAEVFYEDFYAAWQEHGIAALTTCATKFPKTFVQVAAAILPRELILNKSSLTDMDDDEVKDFLIKMRDAITAREETKP